MEFWEAIAKNAPQYLPILGAIAVIIFTRNYVYKGMVPESMLTAQVEREKTLLKEQAEREEKIRREIAERDQNIIETAKDLEQHLEEIVYQLQSLTEKVSKEVGDSNDRITGLERFLSDQLDVIREHTEAIQQLAFQCEKHRKGIPETQVFRKERRA